MVCYSRQVTRMNLRHHALKPYHLLRLTNGFQALAIATTQKAVGMLLWIDGFANLASLASQ